MRKMLVILLSLMLIVTPVLAEEQNRPNPDLFSGFYMADNYLMYIEWFGDMYFVRISSIRSHSEFTEWEYYGVYAPEAKTITVTRNGSCFDMEINDDEILTFSETKYTEGSAIFAINSDETVSWIDQNENVGFGLRFRKVTNEVIESDVMLHRLIFHGLLEGLSEDNQIILLQRAISMMNKMRVTPDYSETGIENLRNALKVDDLTREPRRVLNWLEFIMWLLGIPQQAR